MKTFMGYERADGSAGVRNYVVVMPSVACANGVVAAIAKAVPGVVPLYHGNGCGRGGTDFLLHTRTLQNLCKNPNIAAILIIGLGCESIKAEGLSLVASLVKKPAENIVIQDEGGSQRTAEKGIAIVRRFIEEAEKVERKPIPIEKLRIGLECGGSDAFSGITANPSVGLLSDWIVEEGGTAILTETTEMIGTSHILERRAINTEVAQGIKQIISDQENKTYEVLGPLAKAAVAPGNMDGGLSSIREKSLGCIIKSGSKPITQVIDYAEIPDQRGIIIMDGPGYDVDSMTGLASAGCQLIVFTTGRGNPLGFPIVPVIKVASTTKLFKAMEDDMDINAGAILDGKSINDVGNEIISLTEKVIGGEKTKAEINEQNGILCMYTRNTSF
jgi:altronate dehydratase large subunit